MTEQQPISPPAPANPKLNTLYNRMQAQQRALIMQAAEAGVLPSAGALAQISVLERSLAAVDAAIEEGQQGPAQPGPAPAATVQEKPMHAGTVKWFNARKGFGFIQPDGDGPDAFVHITAVERAGLTALHEGERLTYDLTTDRRTGKPAADNLSTSVASSPQRP